MRGMIAFAGLMFAGLSVSAADAADFAVYRPDVDGVSSTDLVRWRSIDNRIRRSFRQADRQFDRNVRGFQRDVRQFDRRVDRTFRSPRYYSPRRAYSPRYYGPRGGVQIGGFGIYW